MELRRRRTGLIFLLVVLVLFIYTHTYSVSLRSSLDYASSLPYHRPFQPTSSTSDSDSDDQAIDAPSTIALSEDSPSSDTPPADRSGLPKLPSYIEPANATLGVSTHIPPPFHLPCPFEDRLTDVQQFGAIAAVSHATSPRRKGLLTAAYITNLAITIPPQPLFTDDDIRALKLPDDADPPSMLTRGSALAWLGHLNVLRWFLEETELETVLILEDDVDWDVHIRSWQVPVAAAAARSLIARAARVVTEEGRVGENYDINEEAEALPLPSSQDVVSAEAAGGYWGNTSTLASGGWDTLYLGHCGDKFEPSIWTTGTENSEDDEREEQKPTTFTNNPEDTLPLPKTAYFDPTLPDPDDLHPYTQDFLGPLNLPPSTRLIHRSVSPLCTFGYAVTRAAAHKLLHETAAKEEKKGCPAYDVKILEACRDDGYKCWSVNPEIFHHLEGGSLISGVDGKAATAREEEYDDEEAEDEDGGEGISDEQRKCKRHLPRKTSDWDTGDMLHDTLTPPLDPEKVHQAQQEQAQRDRLKKAGVMDDWGRLAGAAPNIRCGARGAGMYSEDAKTLEFLRHVVGDEGRCLRDQLAEDMSRWP